MTAPKYRKIPVESITVDDRYQRELSEPRIRKIVANFDPRQLGVLEVSERVDGTLAVFDGQHRLAALKAMGESSAPCLVHEMDAEEEAELFVRLQRDRKSLSQLDRFKAQLFSGDEQAVEIHDCATNCGFRIGKVSDAGRHRAIRAIVSVENIYKRGGYDLLSDTLGFVVELWDQDLKSTDGYFLEGVSEFIAGYKDRIGEVEKDKLREVAPTVILRRVLGPMSGGGSGTRRKAVAAEIRKLSGVRGRPVVKSVAKSAPTLKLVA